MGTVHLVTYLEFDDEGEIRSMRTYGDFNDVPVRAHAVGVG
jgi:hypothetical protein